MKGMKRVLIYDATPDFIESVELYMQINDDYSLDIAFITKNYADFAVCIKNNKNALDAILVNAERLPMMPKEADAYGLPMYFYTTNEEYKDMPEFAQNSEIGTYKLGEEERFLTDASRMVNGWDISPKDFKKEIPQNDETHQDVPQSKNDEQNDDIAELKRQLEEMKALLNKKEEPKEKPEEKPKEKKAKEETKIISVYSGKGGTGKTTIASQIAVSLARTPMHRGFARVCLIDFDFELGDVSNMFNLPEYSNEPLDEFILTGTRKGIEKDDIERFTFVPEGLGDISKEGSLRILPAPRSFIDARSIKPETIDEALLSLKASGLFDYIVCDTGNNLNKASLASLFGADDIYVIYTPDFTTIKCNDSVIEGMLEISESFQHKLKAVINKASKRSGLSADKIKDSLKNNLNIDVIGVISPDEDVTYCNNFRLPIALDKDKKYFNELAPILKDIVGERFELPDIKEEIKQEKKEEKMGFFRKLFKKKR